MAMNDKKENWIKNNKKTKLLLKKSTDLKGELSRMFAFAAGMKKKAIAINTFTLPLIFISFYGWENDVCAPVYWIVVCCCFHFFLSSLVHFINNLLLCSYFFVLYLDLLVFFFYLYSWIMTWPSFHREKNRQKNQRSKNNKTQHCK